MRKSCENLCFLRFCIHRRPQTCENTGFCNSDALKPCVFTGLGPPMGAKPKKTQVFAAFSHGFLRMSLAFFFLFFFAYFRIFCIFACLRPAPRRPSRSLGRADENAKGVSKRVRGLPPTRHKNNAGPRRPPTTCQKTHNSFPRSYLRVFRTKEGGEVYD